MLVRLTEQALDDFKAAPPLVQKLIRKQVLFLASNIRHPSLHAKKYDEASDIWQARVSLNWRFYFLIAGNEYIVTTIQRHPK
jgi:mRNA-degrading endonuclease RelE of RelBE toxin-antitoxin system